MALAFITFMKFGSAVLALARSDRLDCDSAFGTQFRCPANACHHIQRLQTLGLVIHFGFGCSPLASWCASFSKKKFPEKMMLLDQKSAEMTKKWIQAEVVKSPARTLPLVEADLCTNLGCDKSGQVWCSGTGVWEDWLPLVVSAAETNPEEHSGSVGSTVRFRAGPCDFPGGDTGQAAVFEVLSWCKEPRALSHLCWNSGCLARAGDGDDLCSSGSGLFGHILPLCDAGEERDHQGLPTHPLREVKVQGDSELWSWSGLQDQPGQNAHWPRVQSRVCPCGLLGTSARPVAPGFGGLAAGGSTSSSCWPFPPVALRCRHRCSTCNYNFCMDYAEHTDGIHICSCCLEEFGYPEPAAAGLLPAVASGLGLDCSSVLQRMLEERQSSSF